MTKTIFLMLCLIVGNLIGAGILAPDGFVPLTRELGQAAVVWIARRSAWL